MAGRKILTTLEEDFKQFGIPLGEACKTEEGCSSGDEDEEEDEMDGEDEGSEEEDDEKDDDEEKDESVRGKGKAVSEDDDPIDGLMVTRELLDKIKGLSIDKMKQEDIEAILEGLADKEIDESDEELMAEARDVVSVLKEGAAGRIRRFKAGSTARKTSFQCPQGFRAVKAGGGKGRPKCVPAHVAAGGMGALNKQSRKKAKWSRSGKGKISSMKSGRVEKRRSAMRSEDISPFAMELMSLHEDVKAADMTVRDEIVDRMASIFSLMSEEFMDHNATAIYEDAVSSVLELQSSGRLDEDVLNESEFLSAIEPAMQLLIRSFARIEDGDLGNA